MQIQALKMAGQIKGKSAERKARKQLTAAQTKGIKKDRKKKKGKKNSKKKKKSERAGFYN